MEISLLYSRVYLKYLTAIQQLPILHTCYYCVPVTHLLLKDTVFLAVVIDGLA